jgi:hypothetical protein
MSFRKSSAKAKALGVSIVVAGQSAFASASYSVPAPDYTDFFAGVGVMLGVAMTIMLARKLKGFIR